MLIAVLLAGAGLLALSRLRRPDQTPASASLAAVPLAVLLLATPIPIQSFQAIRTFQSIAETGSGGLPWAVNFGVGFTRALLTGAIGFVAVMLAAGWLLWSGGPETRVELGLAGAGAGDAGEAAAVAPERPAGSFQTFWSTAMLIAPAALLIPAVALSWLASGLPPLLVEAAVVLTGPDPPRMVAGMELSAFSQTISSRLVIGSVGGAALAFASAVFAAGAMAAHRYGSPVRALDRVAWGVLAACLLGGTAYAVLLVTRLVSLARLHAT